MAKTFKNLFSVKQENQSLTANANTYLLMKYQWSPKSSTSSLLLKRMRPDIKFIIGGDYEQLLPVNDRVENCDYENSSALHELTDGNRLNLTTCRRYDSAVYTMCLKENITKLKKEEFTHNKIRTNIRYTNEMRQKINAEIMAEVVAENKTKIKSGKIKSICL
jgi:hypothetical protein